MPEEYNHDPDERGLRYEVRDALTNSHLAKFLSTLALKASAIALAVSIWAINKVSDTQSTVNNTANQAHWAKTK